MIALTYLSSATTPFSTADLEALLAHAREKNAAMGVTGRLLHADGSFIQTIEGEAADVDALFARIEADPRHRDIMVTLREEVEGRSFAEWSMGFDHVDAEQARTLPGFDDFLQSSAAVRAATLEFSRAGTFHRIFSEFPR